jgi:hypothetical protein
MSQRHKQNFVDAFAHQKDLKDLSATKKSEVE